MSEAPALPPGDPRHGTPNGYGNLRCRCQACRAAHAAKHRAYMERVRREGRQIGRHGRELRYEAGCRCERCSEAHNARSRAFKRKRSGD